jgi:hypothetical protein
MMTVDQLLSLLKDFRQKAREIRNSDRYPFYKWCCQNVPGYKTFEGNLAFRLRVLKACQNNEDARDAYFAMSSRDPLFYVNTFVWTYDPRRLPLEPNIPFITYEFQDVAIDDVLWCTWNKRDLLIEKSRDQGASWILAVTDDWCWRFKRGYSSLLGSRNEQYVDNPSNPKSLFWKIDYIRNNLPGWFLAASRYKRIYLSYENKVTGSTISGESTTGDFARGGRWTKIGLDEFAAVEPDGQKVLNATRDATKCRIFNSTHQGTHTAFYRMTKTKIKKLQLHWSLHPVKQIGLYYSKDGQLVLCDKEFKGPVTDYEGNTYQFPEEYPFRLDGKLRSPYYDYEEDRTGHPVEIAQELDMDPLAAATQFFASEIKDRIEKEDCRPALLEGRLEYDEETLEPIEFIEEAGGPLKLWILLGADGQPDQYLDVAAGIDISTGTGASNSASCWGDLLTKEKIAEYVDPYITPEEFAKLTVAMAKWFNNAYLIWDGGGVGGIFGKTVIENGYRNFYYQRQEERLFQADSDKPGFFLNPKPKKTLLGLYRKALKDRTFIQRSKDSNDETMEFVYTTRGTVEHASEYNNVDPSGAKDSHGDRVVADALLNKAYDIRYATHDENDKESMPWNCFAAREKKAMAVMAREDDGIEPYWDTEDEPYIF